MDPTAEIKTDATCASQPPSISTNFQKICEFHAAAGLALNREPPPDLFKMKELMKLRIDLIEEELDELKQAIAEKDFVEVRDAIADILYVTYGAAASFGIDADHDYGLVHASNMSKFCVSEEEAEATVEKYRKQFEEGDTRYDSPAYRESEDKSCYIVYNESTGKILKSINYSPVDLT